MSKAAKRLFVWVTLTAICILAAGCLSDVPGWWARQCALAAYTRRDYPIAWDWGRRSAWFNASHPETELLLSRLERKRGHLDLAGQHLRRSEALGLGRDRVHREDLLLQAQQGDIANIIKELYQLLIHHSEEGAEICDAIANGLLMNGQLIEADSLIEQWAQAFPMDPQPDYLKGRIAEFHRNLPNAEKNFRHSLTKNPKFFPAAIGLGRVLGELNRWDDALKAYRVCLEFPDQAPAQIGMARCLVNLGREEDAYQLLSRLVDRPRDGLNDSLIQLGEQIEVDIFSFELGTLESKQGNQAAAIQWLQRAVDYNPRHREARYQLARSLKSAGRSEEAKGHFDWYQSTQEKSDEINRLLDQVKLDPENPTLRYRLGMLYREIGSEKAGEFWLRSVLTDDPNHAEANAALQHSQQ
jgi:tetratricopeptide (TPR) repeat protein